MTIVIFSHDGCHGEVELIDRECVLGIANYISMNLFTDASISLRWALRCGEWLLLLMTALTYVLDQATTPELFFKLIGFNTSFFLLSFIFPLNYPLWQRRAYVALEIFLAGIGLAAGIELSFILYLVLIKSCFLLSRHEVVLTNIVGGTVWLASLAWIYPSLLQREVPEFDGVTLQSNLYITLLQALLHYFSASIFVVLLGSVIVAERESRQRAEALSREVEILAVGVERLRIAREIHDSLGHALTSLGIQLELAQQLRGHNLEKSFHSIDNAALLAAQCLQDVRQLVQAMRQSSFNLNKSLYEVVEQMRQQGISTHINLHLPPLSLQINHQLYCILKEGLINAQKHARASHVTLKGQIVSNSIVINLQDNGQGFDPEGLLAGYGLQGIQERVELLRGTLKISTAPQQGTQIQVVIPYDSSSRS